VNAEFNWWLLIVGLVVGAGLVWYAIADSRRREADLEAEELPREAVWLSARLADEGHIVPPEVAERLLLHHRAYLEAPPPDELTPDELAPDEPPQSSPTMTGSAPVGSPPTEPSETPNVAPSASSATEGESPTQ
jgi:hypothetical protein